MAGEDKKRGLGSAPEETREEVARSGGEARKEQIEGGESDMDYPEMGHMGGEAAQERGTAHELTREERAKGGEHSHGGGRKTGDEE